jgi:hypothetical protein
MSGCVLHVKAWCWRYDLVSDILLVCILVVVHARTGRADISGHKSLRMSLLHTISAHIQFPERCPANRAMRWPLLFSILCSSARFAHADSFLFASCLRPVPVLPSAHSDIPSPHCCCGTVAGRGTVFLAVKDVT